MKKTVRDIELKGKKVIVRCDFNVPIKNGNITDDTRITAAVPTIKYLLEQDCAVILMSHMGRPKGEPKMEYTLKPVADRLSQVLDREIEFVSSPAVVDDAVSKAAAELKNGQIMLLENVRFVKGETDNDTEFAKKLASLAEVFVNDAFGTAHRAHSSTAGIAQFLPSVSGFLIEKELGGGWVGEEALAIAVYCCLKYPYNIKKALTAAVNHSGDSDSTGAVAGNILGAYLGMDAIPKDWFDRLELVDVMQEQIDRMMAMIQKE